MRWPYSIPTSRAVIIPAKSLCGAGVAFKIAQALFAKFKDALDQARLVPSFLKMVAIATIADAVPLVGENRMMAGWVWKDCGVRSTAVLKL